MNRLTLAEIAARYRRTPKTFRKYVLCLAIPHIKLGRDMLFDPLQVDKFLESKSVTPAEPKLPGRKPAKSSHIERSEFAGML